MGILGDLLGSKKQTVPATGIYAQPKAYQKLYEDVLNSSNKFLFPDGKTLNSSVFTPLAETADETAAFNQIRTGFTPTAESLQSDIAMQQNPYNQYVIDEMNRQAGGDYSILKQAMTDAGQFGSNRMTLGANDINLSQKNQIGSFLSDQFNTSLNNALTTLPSLRASDAQGLLGIGNFQRDLTSQTNLAPLQALLAGQSTLSGLGTMGMGTPQTTVKSGNGFLSNLLSTGLSAGMNYFLPGSGALV